MLQLNTDVAAARAAVESNPHWYHTIDLAEGVSTPGHIDLRATAPKVLPADLSGRRALDVGTFDGFWAFEMERRGAQALALDLPKHEAAEWPPNHRAELERRSREWDIRLGRGFRLASEMLGASAERIELPVYELEPGAIGGPVDVVFMGALLLHLRDPVRALEAIHATLKPGGELILLETFSVSETLRAPRRPVAHFEPLATQFNWWHANLSLLKAWPWVAGFVDVRRTGFHRPPARRPMGGWYAAIRARRPA